MSSDKTINPSPIYWADAGVNVSERLLHAFDDSTEGSEATTSSIKGYAAAATGAVAESSSSSKKQSNGNDMLDILSAGIDPIFAAFKDTASYPEHRAFLLEVGNKCLSAASDIWVETMLLIMVVGAFSYILSAWQGTG